MAILAPTPPSTPDVAPEAGTLLAGARNIFDKELREWFRTRRFFVSSLLTSLLVASVPIIAWVYYGGLRDVRRITLTDNQYSSLIFVWMALALTLCAYLLVALTMGLITTEEKTGTAQWVFTKPVSRVGYVLAKWSANTAGAVIAVVLPPSIVFFALEIATTTNGVPHPAGVLMALLLIALHTATVIAVIVGLSGLFGSSGAIAGIAIGMNFLPLTLGGLLDAWNSWIAPAFPVYTGQIAANFAANERIHPWEPVISCGVFIVVGLLVGCYRLSRRQLQ